MAQCIKCNDWFHQNCENMWMLYLGREHLSPVVLVKSNITSFFTQERCDIIVQAKDIVQSRDSALILCNLWLCNLEIAQIPKWRGTVSQLSSYHLHIISGAFA